MQTLSEHMAALEAAQEKQRTEKQEARKKLFDSVLQAGIPLHRDTKASERFALRKELRNGHGDPVGYTCDHCRTELLEAQWMSWLNPLMRGVVCIGCGWSGSGPI